MKDIKPLFLITDSIIKHMKPLFLIRGAVMKDIKPIFLITGLSMRNTVMVFNKKAIKISEGQCIQPFTFPVGIKSR